MIKGINPFALAAGMAVISTFLVISFVCVNIVIYAVMDTEPYAEAVPVESRDLITKADL